VSIIAVGGIAPAPIQGGNPELGQAAGLWTAEVQVIGDASGGAMKTQFDFASSLQGKSGNMFSLEQLGIVFAASSAGGLLFQVINMHQTEKVTNRVNFEIGMSQPVTGERQVPQATEGLKKMGLFLGQQASGGVACGFTISRNNLDGISMNVSALGYWWPPAAKRAPGGLVRPLGPFPF